MIDVQTWTKAASLLDARERRNALIVLGIVILSSLSSALMIGSVMPFLAVLVEPQHIHTAPILSAIYETFGFTSDFAFLVGLGVATLLVIVLANLVQILRVWSVARFTLMRMHTLSHRLLAAYLHQPYEFFLQSHSGRLSTQILSESQQVVTQFFRPAADVIASGLTVLSIIALLLWIEPVVAAVAFGLLGGIYFVTLASSRRMLARIGKRRVDADVARYRIANEALGGVKYIKLACREASYVDRYERPSRELARSITTVNVLSEVPHYIMQAVAFGGGILFCLALLDPASLQSGEALGDILPILGVFAFAGQRLLPELAKLYRGLTQVQYGGPAVQTVYADLKGKARHGLPKTRPVPLRLSRDLRIENVSYRYPNSAQPNLREVSLAIRAGEKIGIMGSTGAGKTTLADVILALLRPQEGQLIVDGTPLSDDNVRAWQRAIGYVPQEIFLTDSNVAENIALGVPLPDIDMERVQRAAQVAQIDAFVRAELSEGYDTLVGERGVRLSGGQRQRLGIARALYSDADLIVFDEATSALDNLTEQEVLAAIAALPGEKTVLMIAHRLTTLRICDRIVVLDKGRIVGVGSWDELMRSNATFQSIAQAVEAA